MIHILCLNPTIDRMYYIDSFLPGFQYHGNQGESYPGGKGMNILRVLSEFVSPLSFYAFTAGGNGEIIKREAERLKALSVFIEVQGETRTTINIMDKKMGRETEIKENDIVILSGSLPEGMDRDAYLKISRIADKKGASVLLDTGGSLLKSSLPGKYYLIKPNENEIREFFDDYSSPLSLLSRKLQEKGAENVLVTRGGEGAYFVGREREYEIRVPKINVVSTIGSGDSTLAGFAYGLYCSLPLIDTLSLALSFGSSNALHREVGRVEKEEIEEIRRKIEIKEADTHAF